MFDERIALALPSLAGYDLFPALAKARALGFQSVMGFPGGPRTSHSLGEFPTFGLYGADEAHRAHLRQALRDFRHLSMHQAWDTEWRAWVDCAAEIGAEVLTVHARIPGVGRGRDEALSERAEALRWIGDYAGEKGIRVGVENEGGRCVDYLQLIERADHPSVGATIDVGHCAYFDVVKRIENVDERVDMLNRMIGNLVEVLEAENKLFHLHVHNVRREDWRDHRRATEGVVDFPAVFAKLKAVGYSGLFDIELEEPEREKTAAETGAYLTALCREVDL